VRLGERPQPVPWTLPIMRIKSGAPGQELVELAILFPLLMLIAFGVLDLGRLFHSSITIANAAREGARFGTFDPFDSSGIVAATQAEAQSSGIDLSGSTITVSCPDGACGSGLPVRVTIQYPFQLLTGMVFLNPTLTLGGEAEMMMP
jgi:Flp pilus assembly protein TadG